MSWAAAAKSAKAWLSKPNDEALARVRKVAAAMNGAVPEAQKDAWEKLLRGLAKDDDPRRKERIEALVRACTLFGGPLPPSKPKVAKPKPPPPALDWRAPVDALPGIGPNVRAKLEAVNVSAVADLLFQLPSRYDDRRAPTTLAEAIEASAEEERVVFSAPVHKADIVNMRGRRALRVTFKDGNAQVTAWWFFLAHNVLAMCKPGVQCIVSGKLAIEEKKPARMIHPDVALDVESARTVVPVGPRLGAPAGIVRKAIAHALVQLPSLPDPVPKKIATRESLPALDQVLGAVHLAKDGEGKPLVPTIETRRAALERLAWVEAFTRARDRIRGEAGENKKRALPLKLDKSAYARLKVELGFTLTDAQTKAIAAVHDDLAKPKPMRRLLLGDVGTGKTAVALAAVAQCVANGAQAAILAPTTILAEQYMDAVAPLARATGVPIAFVGSGAKSSQKKSIESALANGSVRVAIGTHALFRESIQFQRLGLVVVDEQHRLGVAQRLALSKKQGDSGLVPHLLTLSATPIPRSLALALRGELATSNLPERPKGRPPVVTELVSRERFDEVLERIKAAVGRGERVFFVAPRIEVDDDEADGDPSYGAIDRAKEISELLDPVQVTLVHGAMKPIERTRAMRAFRAGDAQVLVGTTVIEVGVDVPEATLMVIDGANRFGLAQLHQMRGRVGRGERPGHCILMHDEKMTPIAVKRLKILRDHADGATVAKADLELRGAGDLGGTRQSGAEEELLYLDPASPPAWLGRIEADAKAIEAADPLLLREEHRALAHFVAGVERALVVRAEAG